MAFFEICCVTHLLSPAEHCSGADLLFHGHPTYKLQGTCSAAALVWYVFVSPNPTKRRNGADLLCFLGCHGTCSVMAVVCSVFLSLLNPAEHYSSPDLLFHGHPTYKLQGTCSATALACSVFLSCQARQSPAVVLTCIVPAVFQGLTAYLTTLRTLFSASSLFSPCCKTLYSTNPSRACGSTPTSFRGRCPGRTFTSSQAEVGLGGCQCRSGLHLLCFVRGLLFVSVL